MYQDCAWNSKKRFSSCQIIMLRNYQILPNTDRIKDKWETSTDEWRDEWRRMREKYRRVKTHQRQMRYEYRRVKTNERQVQRSSDELETITILSSVNPESPTIFASKRTGKFKIKPCMEDFVLCINSRNLGIHEW